MKYVLDASVIIDYLRTKRSDNPFYVLRPTHDFILSLITLTELYSGKSAHEGGSIQNLLEDILGGVEIVIPTRDTAKRAGKLRSDYQLSLGDAFVAALALERNIAVVTFDRKAFGKIKELRLYKKTPLPT